MCDGESCKGGPSNKCRKCKVRDSKKMLGIMNKKRVPMYLLSMRRPAVNVLGKFVGRR